MASCGGRRPPAPRGGAPALATQLDRLGVHRPGRRSTSLLFYAYPLLRNLDLSLRDYTLRSFIDGTADFVGLDNYVSVIQSSTFAPALLNTAVFTFVSIAFQFTIGLALAVFFFRRFPLVGHPARPVPRAVAAAAAGLGIHLGLDAEQRVGHRQRRCSARSASARSTG